MSDRNGKIFCTSIASLSHISKVTGNETVDGRRRCCSYWDYAWVKKFTELVSLRDGQVRLLTTELSSLKNYEATIQQTLSEIDKIENYHRKSIRMVENYDFRDAFNLLGKECFKRIFHNMGIYKEIQLDVRDVSVQESGTQSKYTTSIFGVDVETPNIIKNLTHDETDTDNYGSVWGASNDVN